MLLDKQFVAMETEPYEKFREISYAESFLEINRSLDAKKSGNSGLKRVSETAHH